MPKYRCLNCKAELDTQACPACELDATKEPRDADLFAKVETVHFDPPTKVQGRGKNHAACDTKLRVGRAGHRFTGEPSAVNCEACKASQAFRDSNGENNGVADIPLNQPKKGK